MENNNEVKQGFEFLRELPKEKKRACRRALIYYHGKDAQKMLKRPYTRQVFFCRLFSLWNKETSPHVFYFLEKGGVSKSDIMDMLDFEINKMFLSPLQFKHFTNEASKIKE